MIKILSQLTKTHYKKNSEIPVPVSTLQDTPLPQRPGTPNIQPEIIPETQPLQESQDIQQETQPIIPETQL